MPMMLFALAVRSSTFMWILLEKRLAVCTSKAADRVSKELPMVTFRSIKKILLSNFGNVPVVDDDRVACGMKSIVNTACHCNGAMFTTGAAQSDNKLVFTFSDVVGDKEGKHVAKVL